MNIQDKIKTGQFVVNEELKQVTFQDLRFYTPDSGKTYFPSVTTILDAYPKTAAFYDWLKRMGEDADTIRDEAGTRGSLVHQLTESYDKGDTVTLFDADGRIRYKSTEWKMFEKYADFCCVVKPEILQTEYNIISPELGTAGTIDRKINLNFGKVKGKFLLDIKTSNAIHDQYFLQLAAYAKMDAFAFPDEPPVDGVCVLWLNAKTRGESKTGSIQGRGWQLVFPPKDLDYYWRLFRCTQMLWNEVNGDLKPNNLTYNIEYKK